jgi:AraC-like DNA-binding protein
MLLNEVKPTSFLSEYIRLYRIIDFCFPGTASIPPKIYSPRPEQCLQFYPKDTETVRYPDADRIISNKQATVVGQHTITNHRYVGREFLSFQVVFQPGVLYRLTGIPMQEVSNQYMDAEDLFGTGVREVNEQLYGARSYEGMVGIVETFLSTLIKGKKKEQHIVDAASKSMLLTEHYSVDTFLKESCLCHRQFDRKFKERVGIPPKQFLQLTRFDRAFRMKNRYPHKDWLTIAIHCGYHDYQHLVKDYKEFTGYTPVQFFEIDNTAPERAFGDAEV